LFDFLFPNECICLTICLRGLFFCVYCFILAFIGSGGSTTNNIVNSLQVTWNAIVHGYLTKNTNTRMWTLANGLKWDDVICSLYNRACYDDLLAKIQGKREVLIYGTPGIGKSLFLMVLLVHIVEQFPTAIPSICYCRKENKVLCKYMLLPDGSIQMYNASAHGVPAYLLSDSVDIDQHGLSTVLSLEVASDKEANYNDFLKRIGESGDAGLKVIMPLFSLNELKTIKPKLPSSDHVISDEEAEFRYNVYGGSARNFVIMANEPSNIVVPEVEETLLWMFGDDKMTLFPNSWSNIISNLSNKLRPSVAGEHPAIVNSMFVHLDASTGSVWASKFIEILIGSVVDKMDKNLLQMLEKLIGKSGVGIAFETLGHKELTQSKQKYLLKALNKPYQKSNKAVDTSMSFNGPIRLIRTIENIGELEEGEYGLPVISNFALIDAVIQPNTLINFTISNTHKGAVGSLDSILEQLQDPDNARIVIVTKRTNLDSFRYMNELSKIRQYVTTYEPMVARTALGAKKGSSGKRKHST
jgi:DNA polymerase III delta prime subunit